MSEQIKTGDIVRADWREMRELLAQAQWQGYPPPIATREMLEATADD